MGEVLWWITTTMTRSQEVQVGDDHKIILSQGFQHSRVYIRISHWVSR